MEIKWESVTKAVTLIKELEGDLNAYLQFGCGILGKVHSLFQGNTGYYVCYNTSSK